MLKFYKNATFVFLALTAFTLVLAWLCLERVFVSDALFPASESVIPWTLESSTDVFIGGTSSTIVKDSTYGLDYQYRLTEDKKFPFVSQYLRFGEVNKVETLADLSAYSTAKFTVRCVPRNVLAFYLHSFDARVTDPKDRSTYRISTMPFSCDEEWSEVEINLGHLNVALWWLETFDIEVTDSAYALDKVRAISIDASRNGPMNIFAQVEISEFSLNGFDWHYVVVFVVLSGLVWIVFIFWLFKQYARSLVEEVKHKLQKDLPLIAYQQLSIEPHRDEEKSQVLRFMATEYANPELTLDLALNVLGINRSRINEILKKELGFTFNTYLNKLRLAEAARLLSATEDANVTQIACSVGYNNVSYFNKLFKNEYGCTPKTFKNISQSGQGHQ